MGYQNWLRTGDTRRLGLEHYHALRSLFRWKDDVPGLRGLLHAGYIRQTRMDKHRL